VYASGSARRSAWAVLLGVLPSVEDAVLDELTHRVKLCADQCVEPLVEMKHATGRENVSSSTNVASSWRWGESNPRPRATFQGFSGRSRWGDLASRLPPAEDLSASPGSMSGGGPRAEPLP
jgi:hypothetical protein